jgi:hypothetical protein
LARSLPTLAGNETGNRFQRYVHGATATAGRVDNNGDNRRAAIVFDVDTERPEMVGQYLFKRAELAGLRPAS